MTRDWLLTPEGSTPQYGMDELRNEALYAKDPLNIVNRFMCCPEGVGLLHPYWERRLCALAEFIVERPRARRSAGA